MRPIGKSKPKTISDRLKEVGDYTGLSTEHMAFVFDKKEQVYKHYKRGAFDGTYSIREDYMIAQIVYFEEGLDEKIDLLKNAKKSFKRYTERRHRSVTPPRKIWLKARIKFLKSELKKYDKKTEDLFPVIHQNGTPKHKKKSGKKNGKNLTPKQG